ncbi:response regulator transcription factor [Gracilimonas sediminicola]|uniref:Response regulator transcription factor n=1 Tax=Gracilimonas sediminicola TaxID=2952158 RepID=A0A9X2L1Z7_9BACT|nr:response regulator transcription factor [Gracilimonas sediminicola]MCP9290807.1 response regulator transcription factor [Gracilimonas sediminicola]
MGNVVKTLIADDHPLMRNGLQQVLEGHEDFEIITAENGKEALDLIRTQSPQIAILDIEMPELTGFEVAKQVYHEGISIDIIFLTMYKDESLFNKAMDIGVKGYVLKENTVSEIIQCVQTVLSGKHYLSPAISEFLIRRNSKLVAPASDKDGLNSLTKTEKNIIKQLAEMKTSQEIADENNVSIKTIQNHRNNICNKLGLSGTHALLKYAVEHASKL